MTKDQRNYFFAVLWPKACRVQGWIGVAACEVKRRAVVLQATTELYKKAPHLGKPTDSMSASNQDQLTAVFNLVKHLGNPNDLGPAIAASNAAQAAIADECRRLVWKIRDVAKRDTVNLNDAYIQKIAAWDCREARVTSWADLPPEGLRRVLIHVNARANALDEDIMPRKDRRRADAPAKPFKTYQMKPATKFVSKPKPVLVPDDNCPY